MAPNVIQLDKIRTAVEKREKTWRAEISGQIALGLALTFIVPMVLSGLASCGGHRELGIDSGFVGWGLGVVACGVAMAIAYGMEWWYRGSYLMQRLQEIGKTDLWRDTLNERHWKYEAREAAAWMEIWMFVPRQVFEGWGKWRGSQLVEDADREWAVGILGEMMGVDRAVQVETLRQEYRGNAGALGFDKMMAYLVFYQWVTVSENGERAWLGKISRDDLSQNTSEEN